MSKPIQLNDYQRLMYKLATLSPYNAVHTVLFTQIYEVKEIEQALCGCLVALDFFERQFIEAGERFSYQQPASGNLIKKVSLPLDEHALYELNRPFQAGEFPLRFFMLTFDSQVYFSLTYNHWVGDALAIAQLINMLLVKLAGKHSDGLRLSNQITQNNNKLLSALHGMPRVVSQFMLFARAYRLPIQRNEYNQSIVTSFQLSSKQLKEVKIYSKRHAVTVNDLFVATIAQVMGQFTQQDRCKLKRKRFKPKRDRLIISVIYDAAKRSLPSTTHNFGLNLSLFNLSFKAPEKAKFCQLLQQTNKKTKKIKRNNIPYKNLFLFKLQNYLWDRTKNKRKLFSKSIPVVAGISNLNMSELLKGKVNAYWRYSPSSLMCPLVFNFTTVNEQLFITLTANDDKFSEENLAQLKHAFVSQIAMVI